MLEKIDVEVLINSSKGLFDPLRHYIEKDVIEYVSKHYKEQLPCTLQFHEEHEINSILLQKSVYVRKVHMEARDFTTTNIIKLSEPSKQLILHLYCLQNADMEVETLEDTAAGTENEAENVVASNHYILPSVAFESLWSSLHYENHIKERLLHFALSALTFAQLKFDTQIINSNRLILLHGPPGTGKTTLCQALAQKVAIRAGHLYRYTHLIEINSHSLFSKWFSESGKLVMRLFSKIREIVADSQNLVCVLIDEVESLTFARAAMSNEEPRDALRVVNAVLTQLDSLKKYTNVLIFTTSNLSESIDLAFLDRADIKQYIGLPDKFAVNSIYKSMIDELLRVNYLLNEPHIKYDELLEISAGKNGRTLRKLPFMAHAELCRKANFQTPITQQQF